MVFECGVYNSRTQFRESEHIDAVDAPWNNICINDISTCLSTPDNELTGSDLSLGLPAVKIPT